jgi:hypothetical protein
MKSCNLLVLCVLFVVASLNAQTDFRPGYIIKAEGDSLFGEIDYRNENIMSQVCKFRKSKKDQVQKFYPNEILGYRFPESKYYVSKKYNEKTSFFEFLVKGKISFYYSCDSEGEHYFVEKENEPLFEITGKEEIEKIKEINIFVESTKHIGVLTYLMQDAPTLQPEINKLV